MPELVISGASDDLVEIEGLVAEEINAETALLLVVAPDGRQAKVRVTYNDDGVWEIGYAPVGEDQPTLEGALHAAGYSSRLTLEAPEGTLVHVLEAK